MSSCCQFSISANKISSSGRGGQDTAGSSASKQVAPLPQRMLPLCVCVCVCELDGFDIVQGCSYYYNLATMRNCVFSQETEVTAFVYLLQRGEGRGNFETRSPVISSI